jgi:hypothetical protein
MTDEAIKAFLANGGVIQQVAVGVSGITEGSTYSLWGAPRKPGRPPAVDVPVKVIEPTDSDDETPGPT